MDLLFVTMTGDTMGEAALRVLAGMKHPTRVLSADEKSPNGSIAIFTPLNQKEIGARRRWLHCSVLRINRYIGVPEWVTTPFRAAVVKTIRQQDSDGRGFQEALRNLANDYAEWAPDVQAVPWAVYEKDPSVGAGCMSRAEKWRAEVFGLNIIIRRKEEPRDYRTVQLNAWSVNFSDERRVFPNSAVEQGLDLLNRWQNSFRTENTWSQRELGTPSLIVRLDCVVHDDQLTVYEVEERPSGLGVSLLANSFFRDRLGSVLQTWPDFRVVISGERAGTDDHIWMQALNRPIDQDADLVLVRAEPEETAFHHLEPQSVSSLVAKGDKAYGESLGLWTRVHAADELPWNEGFVLKPKQGSKMHDVEIWDPLRRPGSAVKSRIVNAMAKHGSMFLQPMVDPMKTGNPKFEWMIYRIFFGYNTKGSSWECLGGNWNARSNLRIHGASDALFGPAILE